MKVYVIVILSLIKLSASEVDEELQEKFMTLSRSDFVEHFNKKNYSWKIKQYTNITPNMRFGVQNRDINDLPVNYIDPETVSHPLPESFDAREKYPRCFTIGKIRNQYSCNSCWAHSVADVASDRMCINTGQQIELSIQDLECSHPHQTICHDGLPSIGFKFWKDIGLVSEQCKPYEPFDLNRNTCYRFCRFSPPLLKDYLNEKIRAAEVHNVRNDSWQIKAELYLHGPIQASMSVYEDFDGFSGNGIYEHKFGKFSAFHAVRVIGYGVENGVEYWLAANSWGPEWGDGGFFRIKSFQPEIGFEESMITGTPLIVNNNK